MNKIIAVINGPSLNLLGERQPEIYGQTTLAEIEQRLKAFCTTAGFELRFHQSNLEGDLINWVQEYRRNSAGIIINPAGYSHTSVALMDALLAVEVPVVEVHISNFYRREEFRRTSLTARAASGVITGLGVAGYELALKFLIDSHKG